MMKASLLLARRLYACIKELDEIAAKKPHHHPLSEQAAELDRQHEDAEDALADVLSDLKQWSAEL